MIGMDYRSSSLRVVLTQHWGHYTELEAKKPVPSNASR